MQSSDGMMQLGLPRPGKALIGLMLALSGLWLMFAVGLNWGGASSAVFALLAGDTNAILHGEVWRLLTAPLLHTPHGAQGVSHLVTVLLGLYFLGTRLEEHWGSARFLRFVAFTSVLAYALQMLIELALPAALSARVVGQLWWGMRPTIAAIAIAWALTFRGQTVRLFFVLPVTSGMLIAFVIGIQVLHLAAADMPEEGMLAPFGGMFFGWLLGGGSPSPLRKAWLKLRLAQLEGAGSRGAAKRKKPRPNPGGLRVIPGGRADEDDDKGPDGRWLN